eukprot:5353046-Karenia_brevis.AAC.1
MAMHEQASPVLFDGVASAVVDVYATAGSHPPVLFGAGLDQTSERLKGSTSHTPGHASVDAFATAGQSPPVLSDATLPYACVKVGQWQRASPSL